MRRRRQNRPRKDIGHKRPQQKKAFRTAPSISKCKDCREEVMFVRYEKYPFNWCPLDLNRHDDANIKLEGDFYKLLSEKDAAEFRRQGAQLFKNHIIICPARNAPQNPS